MTNSMTAFASIQKTLENYSITCEIKSVNHRYLDISYRLPETLRHLETELRNMIRARLSRGKVECFLRLKETNTGSNMLEVNQELADSLIDTSNKLSEKHQLANDFSVSQLMSWPNLIDSRQPDSDTISRAVLDVYEQAIMQLIEARWNEGKSLQELILDLASSIDSELKKAQSLSSDMPNKFRNKIIDGIKEFELSLDESRLEQEVALLVSKGDINEELARLTVHIDEVRTILDKKGPKGRKLDFLMQELNREANTICSKADETALTQCAIEMKVLIEQMREQIQNIE